MPPLPSRFPAILRLLRYILLAMILLKLIAEQAVSLLSILGIKWLT